MGTASFGPLGWYFEVVTTFFILAIIGDLKMLIKPMPSPSGTNREKIFILQGGKGVLNRRGMAFDAAIGASQNDNVAQIVSWAKENLSFDDIRRLAQALGVHAQQSEPVPAADDGPVVDPMQTRGRAPGARVGMDAASMAPLFQRFPDLARIGRA
jgi:hypothetical protein